MKRMEELIHLNKKINFEGKVSGVPPYSKIFGFLQFSSGFTSHSLCSASADLSSDLSVPLAGETRRAAGGRHPDDDNVWVQAQVAHQARVPPSVQRLPAAIQEEGVSNHCS